MIVVSHDQRFALPSAFGQLLAIVAAQEYGRLGVVGGSQLSPSAAGGKKKVSQEKKASHITTI